MVREGYALRFVECLQSAYPSTDSQGVFCLRVLFLTLASIPDLSAAGVYTDLLREFRDRGDEVYVVSPCERRSRLESRLETVEGIIALRVRTGNLTKAHVLEKGISTLFVQHQFIHAIRDCLGRIRFDLVLYSTPPVTFERVIRYMKARDNCTSYLMLKDIFPQNAVDLGMITHGGIIWRYFRRKEKQLYAISDHIGCMSKANIDYLLRHNPEIPPYRVEECPNSIKPSLLHRTDRSIRDRIRDGIGLPRDDVIFVYGGNLGKPQGIPFILKVLDRVRDIRGVFFLVVGSGTEFRTIEQHLENGNHRNSRLMKAIPSAEYDTLLSACDVGLIFLDGRFTIPNFPSRLTAYMNSAIPVLASTDPATDLGVVLEESGSGIWVRSGDLESFASCVLRLAADPLMRNEMGARGRAYLESNYAVSRTYDTITGHIRKGAGS